MTSLKVCRTSTSDYSHIQFYATFAPIVIFVPKDNATGDQFREAIYIVATGIMNEISVQVRKSRRNVNMIPRLLSRLSCDHARCDFFRILTTTAKSLFISLQPTVAPWLEHGGNKKLSGKAGCTGTIPAQGILETHRQILFSQVVCGSILGMLQEGM